MTYRIRMVFRSVVDNEIQLFIERYDAKHDTSWGGEFIAWKMLK